MFTLSLRSLFVLSICMFVFLLGCEWARDGATPPGLVNGPDVDTTVPIDGSDVIYRSNVVITDNAEPFGVDEYRLNTAAVTGDTLTVSVSFSGGCKEHQFTLVTDGVFLESDPVQMRLSIAHNANNDPCEAYPTEEHQFDLSIIKGLYQSAYQRESGKIILLLRDAPDGLVYEFRD